MKEKIETATFGGGCFWCVEAIFERVKGVQSVDVGIFGRNMWLIQITNRSQRDLPVMQR